MRPICRLPIAEVAPKRRPCRVDRSAAAEDLQTIDDRLQIEQLYARYVYALDTLDAVRYAACFTEDGYLEAGVAGKFKGRSEIRGLIRSYLARFGAGRNPPDSHGRRFSQLRHVVTGLKLDVGGSSARGEAYWQEILATAAKAGGTSSPAASFSLWNMGRYEDELVKRDGTWLFSRRIILADMVPPGAQPAAGPVKK
jgi:SnoaL-like domain